jgi:hypothetical protein
LPLRDINISKEIIIWIFKRMIVVVIEIIVLKTKPLLCKKALMVSDLILWGVGAKKTAALLGEDELAPRLPQIAIYEEVTYC